MRSPMRRKLFALYACVLVAMIGFGVALPVMPLYVERLALDTDATDDRVWLHVGAVTAAYPLMQLVFAPVWGSLSDRIGRKQLVVVGVVGVAVTQTLFGLATGLPLLYGARFVGGALSAALVPAASGYVADLTGADERADGLAHLSLAVAAGGVIGPALGALLVDTNVHVVVLSRHFVFDGFSVPFAAAALLAVLALALAVLTLDRSTAAVASHEPVARGHVRVLLAIGLASYVSIAMFEATFALFGATRFDLGPRQIAIVFSECGLLMVGAQLVTPSLARATTERFVVGIGLILMSVGFVAMLTTRAAVMPYIAVAPLAVGMTFVGPTLTWELSRVRPGQVGSVLGVQQAVQALGNVAGAVLGIWLLRWKAFAPYAFAALLLAVVAAATVRYGSSPRRHRSEQMPRPHLE